MSAQTINISSLTSLFHEVERELIKNTDKMFFEKRFKLGEGYCEDDQAHSLKIYNIISKNYCPLNEFLYKVMKEGIQEDQCINANIPGLTKSKDIKPVNTLYQLWQEKGNIGTFDEFLNVLFNTNVDIWEEAAW